MSQSAKITLLRAKLAGSNHVLDIVAWLTSIRAMAGRLSVSQVVGSAVTARARFFGAVCARIYRWCHMSQRQRPDSSGPELQAAPTFKSHALFCCGAGCGVSPGGSA
jgi:hypothetical protein